MVEIKIPEDGAWDMEPYSLKEGEKIIAWLKRRRILDMVMKKDKSLLRIGDACVYCNAIVLDKRHVGRLVDELKAIYSEMK